jgi:hypothetical protein
VWRKSKFVFDAAHELDVVLQSVGSRAAIVVVIQNHLEAQVFGEGGFHTGFEIDQVLTPA